MNNNLNQNQLLSNIDFNIFLKQSKDNITYSSGLNLSKQPIYYFPFLYYTVLSNYLQDNNNYEME